jgi:hypothetical protein
MTPPPPGEKHTGKHMVKTHDIVNDKVHGEILEALPHPGKTARP